VNVKILTINGINCGSFLQAFALKNKIEQMGHTVYIANTMKSLYLLKTLPSVFGLRRTLNIMNEWNKITYSIPERCEIAIIGSDVVWSKPTKKSSERFFGRVKEKKIITYAPSCSEATYMNLNERNIQSMKNITDFSVRDKKTFELVKKITGISPKIVLDPTFLIDWKSYELNSELSDFILVYSYNRGHEDRQMVIKARELSNKTGMKLVHVVGNQDWCDICIPAHPFEFLGLLRKAEYVITNTFHGTAFSIIYRKPFISFPTSHKVKFLLDLFGIKYNKLFSNYSKIEYKLEEKKKDSIEYLESALKI